MKLTQKLLLLASSFALSTGAARGQASTIDFEFVANSVANYRQSPSSVAFEGGVFSINVEDGNFRDDGCDDTEFYFPFPGCPIGATGWVSRGLENDPELNGRGPYFSITAITAAQILRPFDPLSARLVAAPPSLLPRPIVGFEDRSLSVFFNLFSNFIRQYPITRYNMGRQYTAGERQRFDGEVVPGTYRYNFGSLASPIVPVVLELNQFPMLDGFRKVNNQPRGLRFTNVTYDDGYAVLDPFALNTLTWEGNTTSFIRPGQDVLYLSIKRLTNPSDPLSDPDLNATPLFPSFTGPTITRVLLPSALDTSFILPPNFVAPGATGLIDLEFIIFRPTSNVIFERATRRFRMPVKVTDPFEGFIRNALPPGTSAEKMAPDYDFDGDGVSNFNEWVFKSNPAQPGSSPTSPGVKMVASTPAAPPGGGFSSMSADSTDSGPILEYSVPKLTNSVPALNYSIEYSTDMLTWTKIEAGNPDWNLVETYNEIKVTESGNTPKTGGFFRTKVQAAN